MLAEISGMRRRDAPAGRRGPGRADRHPHGPRLPPRPAATTSGAEVIVPDSSHGTNPATASMAGFTHRDRPLRRRMAAWTSTRCAPRSGPRTAAVMLTNPSTLGLFERARRATLLEAVHAVGALAYMDGANMNAVLGKLQAGRGRLRRDALQPPQDLLHAARRRRSRGRAGGASARSCCRSCPGRSSCAMTDGTLPPGATGRAARVDRAGARLPGQRRRARARVRLHPRARRQRPGARSARTRCWPRTTCKSRLRGDATSCPTTGPASTSSWPAARRSRRRPACARSTSPSGSSTTASTRRPSTSRYIVEECLLIEPTETESVETLDAFADALLAIAAGGARGPRAGPRGAPHTAPVRRLDEATAARQPGPPLAAHDRRRDALPDLIAVPAPGGPAARRGVDSPPRGDPSDAWPPPRPRRRPRRAPRAGLWQPHAGAHHGRPAVAAGLRSDRRRHAPHRRAGRPDRLHRPLRRRGDAARRSASCRRRSTGWIRGSCPSPTWRRRHRWSPRTA